MEKALLGGCPYTSRMLKSYVNGKSELEKHQKICMLEISLIEEIFLINKRTKNSVNPP